jgi:hypothetical protein
MQRPQVVTTFLLLGVLTIIVTLTGSMPYAASPSLRDERTKAGFEGALTRYSLAILVEDDKSFCAMTDKTLLYRMAVAYRVKDDECSKIVRMLAKRQRQMMTTGVRDHMSNVKIEGNNGSVIQTIKFGRSVRLMRIRAQYRGGIWVITGEEAIPEGGSSRPASNLSQS